MAGLDGFRAALLTFRQPQFAMFMTGGAISQTGIWMQRIAEGWLTWQLTESGLWLGLMALASYGPSVIIGPFAGALADRYDQVRTLKLTEGTAMLQSLAITGLLLTGQL